MEKPWSPLSWKNKACQRILFHQRSISVLNRTATTFYFNRECSDLLRDYKWNINSRCLLASPIMCPKLLVLFHQILKNTMADAIINELLFLASLKTSKCNSKVCLCEVLIAWCLFKTFANNYYNDNILWYDIRCAIVLLFHHSKKMCWIHSEVSVLVFWESICVSVNYWTIPGLGWCLILQSAINLFSVSKIYMYAARCEGMVSIKRTLTHVER